MEDYTKAITVKDNSGKQHELTLNIWDAAGDERLHNLAHLFLGGAQVGVLCYAIDDKRSYDQLATWADHIADKAEDEMFTVIVGSKSDLTDHRAVPLHYAKRMQKDTPNCRFTMETSAFENIETIEDLFNQIGQHIIQGGFYSTK